MVNGWEKLMENLLSLIRQNCEYIQIYAGPIINCAHLICTEIITGNFIALMSEMRSMMTSIYVENRVKKIGENHDVNPPEEDIVEVVE